jgi:PEP-CTERM motif
MTMSNRMRVGRVLVAGFAFLAIALGSPAGARAQVIIATYASLTSNDYTYVGGTTSSTLNSTPQELAGDVSFAKAFFPTGGTYAADISLSASSSTAATGAGTYAGTQGGFSGTLTFTNESGGTVGGVANGSVFLTVTFTGATLTATGLTQNASLGSSTSGTTTVTSYLSPTNPISQPESFGLTLSGLTAAGATSTFGFNGFTGNDGGNVSAAVGTIASTPEPSSLAIAGIGALGLIGFGLRRRKALGA